MKKREVLAKNRVFSLIKQTRDHKIWYEVQMQAPDLSWEERNSIEKEATSYFGKPFKEYALGWRFWNRIEANKEFVYTSLRWC